MRISAHKVLLPRGFMYDRTIHIENGVVCGIGPWQNDADRTCDIAVPGLIDEHVHGGFGADLMGSTSEEVLRWLDFMLKNGTTQVLATLSTAPIPMMRNALSLIRDVMNRQENGTSGARISGVHLEGPFLSPLAPGAMDVDSMIPPTVENYQKLTEGYEDLIRLISIAPEREGADELIHYLTSHGVPVQAGHTAATAEEGEHAFSLGLDGICHFFNASTPIHHRKPGILTQALLDNRIFCECICDFVHVHPRAIELIYQMKGPERMILISDDVMTTGLPDGNYTDLTGAPVVVIHGENRTPKGNLYGGSSMILQDAVNLISIGIPEQDAFTMASLTPARHLHMEGGEIRSGVRAEILCMNEKHEALFTILGNEVRENCEK